LDEAREEATTQLNIIEYIHKILQVGEKLHIKEDVMKSVE